MRIALVRARYNPSGGAERFAERAMQALLGADAKVTIVARTWQGGARAGPGWTIERCDPFYLGSIWRDWSFANAVRRCVARLRFDLVQSHERIPGLAIYRAGDGVHAAWLERRALPLGAWARWAIRLNPHHQYLLRMERRMFEHPALRAVICNSTLVAEEIRSRFRIDPAKLRLIPNGVDLEQFAPRPAAAFRVRTRERLGIGDAERVLLFVGSGFERKGLALALRALGGLPAHVRLVVVGRDKRAPRYRALARALGVAARVHFEGEVDDPLPYLGAADALVLPTLYDPFPNAVLEALACGLPVITSDACGAVDVITPGQNGWIHRAADAEDLRAKLELWLASCADPTGEAQVRAAARESVAGHGTAVLAQSLLRLYQDVLGDAPRDSAAK